MLNDHEKDNLVRDFMRWGLTRAKRALKAAQLWGVLLSDFQFSDGHKG